MKKDKCLPTIPNIIFLRPLCRYNDTESGDGFNLSLVQQPCWHRKLSSNWHVVEESNDHLCQAGQMHNIDGSRGPIGHSRGM